MEITITNLVYGIPLRGIEWERVDDFIWQWRASQSVKVGDIDDIVAVGKKEKFLTISCCVKTVAGNMVIEIPFPEPTNIYRNELKKFCDMFGIEWEEPKWYMISSVHNQPDLVSLKVDGKTHLYSKES